MTCWKKLTTYRHGHGMGGVGAGGRQEERKVEGDLLPNKSREGEEKAL